MTGMISWRKDKAPDSACTWSKDNEDPSLFRLHTSSLWPYNLASGNWLCSSSRIFARAIFCSGVLVSLGVLPSLAHPPT